MFNDDISDSSFKNGQLLNNVRFEINSIDSEVISLYKKFRMIEERNQSDINIKGIHYNKIKQIR